MNENDHIQIRKIKKQDNELLASIIRDAFDEHGAPQTGTVYSDPTTDDLFSLFQRPDAVLYVAESGNQIKGCCGIYPTDGLEPGYAELVKFYLMADSRGKGLGRMLMERSIESAIRLGYQYLYIESLPEFSKAVNMYRKLGFEMLSSPLGESGHPTCTIWMLKKLAGTSGSSQANRKFFQTK